MHSCAQKCKILQNYEFNFFALDLDFALFLCAYPVITIWAERKKVSPKSCKYLWVRALRHFWHSFLEGPIIFWFPIWDFFPFQVFGWNTRPDCKTITQLEPIIFQSSLVLYLWPASSGTGRPERNNVSFPPKSDPKHQDEAMPAPLWAPWPRPWRARSPRSPPSSCARWTPRGTCSHIWTFQFSQI